MVKPKLIIDAAVRTQAISVRSCASHVRSSASSLLLGIWVALLTAGLHCRLELFGENTSALSCGLGSDHLAGVWFILFKIFLDEVVQECPNDADCSELTNAGPTRRNCCAHKRWRGQRQPWLPALRMPSAKQPR